MQNTVRFQPVAVTMIGNMASYRRRVRLEVTYAQALEQESKSLESVLKYAGDNPSAATANEGSTRFRFLEALMAAFERIAGHQASTSLTR